MTQPSTSRTSHTGGLRRPALALAFGTAAAASVLAPVASMAATASYNDITSGGPKAVGTAALPTPVKYGGTTAAAQTKLTKALPATAVPASANPVGTIRGDVYFQANANTSAALRTKLNTTYAAWKTAATPVINAYIAYTKAVPAKKPAALKVYAAKLAVYNKKAALATNNGPAKWTAYSAAYNAWSTAYKAQLSAAQANHFKLAAKTAFAGTCTSADNRRAAFFGPNSKVVDAPNVNAPGTANAVTGAGYAIWCNTGTGTLNYYLPDNGHGSGFETFTETITTDPVNGAVNDVDTVTDAIGDSLNTYINGDFFMNADGVKVAVQGAPLVATKRSDINGFATKAIIAGGYLVSGQTCVSIAGTGGATLTCQAFTESLQNALNSAYVVSPK